MIVDLEKSMAIKADGYDVCVIGAGAAGIVLALDLAQRGFQTLLLEGGGKGYEARSQDLYLGEISGRDYKGLYDGRFRTLGGTTTQWGGQILEIDDFIFMKRPWINGSGWPFPKSELQPFYDKASRWERLDQSLKDANDIWQALGLTTPDFEGALVSALSQWCPTTNFARMYGEAIATSKTLTTVLHANACEVLLSEDESNIAEVRCRTLKGEETGFRAKLFVLCMGAIEISRFLLHPDAKRNPTPWGRRGLVGRYYQDHVSCIAADIVEPDEKVSDYFDYVSYSGFRFQPKMKLSPVNQEKLKTLDVCGFVLSFTGEDDDLALAYETYRFLKTRRLKKLNSRRLLHFLAHVHELAWHKIPYSRALKSKGKQRTFKLCVNTEQAPLSDGRIELSEQVDALGLHRPRVIWKITEQEVHSIGRYVDTIDRVFANKKWGSIQPNPDLLVASDEMPAKLEDIFHHMGGTRMGHNESEGVVDPDLKIFGTKNAYVCSSSVFPCAGFANPTHTVIALALRLADHLASTSLRTG